MADVPWRVTVGQSVHGTWLEMLQPAAAAAYRDEDDRLTARLIGSRQQ